MQYLPISLKIDDANCLVVGGGNIALRKAKQLLKCGASLTIVSPEFHADFVQLETQSKLNLVRQSYATSFLDEMKIVIAATDDAAINQKVYLDAEKMNIPVNVVDQPKLCRFIMPSVIDRSPLTVAISTSGSGPVFARMLREKIEWFLPKNIGEFLSKVNQNRPEISRQYTDSAARRKFWESFFEKRLGWSSSSNLANQAPLELDLDLPVELESEIDSNHQITLVDLGDGMLEHLTVETIKLLQKVDSVCLTNHSYSVLVDLIRRDADVHIKTDEQISREWITNALDDLVKQKATTGSHLVILKSGHNFETDKKFYRHMVDGINGVDFKRIPAFNPRSPL